MTYPGDRTMSLRIDGEYEPCPACRYPRIAPGEPVPSDVQFTCRKAGVLVFMTPHAAGCGATR